MAELFSIWRETLDFVRRESKLLMPLAMATLAIGYAAFFLGFGIQTRQGGSGLLMMLLLSAMALMFLGQLAITALVLKPRLSVAESLREATLAMPRIVLISILMGVLLLIVSIPLSIALAFAGIDVASTVQPGQPLSFVLAAPLLGFMLVILARLFPIQAVVIDRKTSVLEALRSSFQLTRNTTLNLLAAIFAFLIASQLVQLVAALISSAIFTPLAAMISAPFAGTVMVALAVGMANAVISLLSTVFAAFFYKSRTQAPQG